MNEISECCAGADTAAAPEADASEPRASFFCARQARKNVGSIFKKNDDAKKSTVPVSPPSWFDGRRRWRLLTMRASLVLLLAAAKLFSLIVSRVPPGQNLRRWRRVTRTRSAAGAHPPSPFGYGETCLEGCGDGRPEHRKRTQQRLEPELGERREANPVCAWMCSGHDAHYAGGRRGVG